MSRPDEYYINLLSTSGFSVDFPKGEALVILPKNYGSGSFGVLSVNSSGTQGKEFLSRIIKVDEEGTGTVITFEHAKEMRFSIIDNKQKDYYNLVDQAMLLAIEMDEWNTENKKVSVYNEVKNAEDSMRRLGSFFQYS